MSDETFMWNTTWFPKGRANTPPSVGQRGLPRQVAERSPARPRALNTIPAWHRCTSARPFVPSLRCFPAVYFSRRPVVQRLVRPLFAVKRQVSRQPRVALRARGVSLQVHFLVF